MTMLLPEIYFYIGILFSIILLLVFFGLYITNRKKRHVLKRIYRKLSDSDKQVFHVIRATEKQTVPTFQNILSFFSNINGIQITTEKLLQHLYRLESIDLVKITVSNLKGNPVQICKSLYSDYSLSAFISKRYTLFSSLFLPLSIISLTLCYFLLQFVDLIVHGDLYGYGLVFSYDWAHDYWNLTSSIRSYLIVVLLLLGISLVLTVANFRSFKKVLKIVICSLFTLGIIVVSYSVFLLSKLDFIVNHDLYTFGLQFSYQWGETYWIYIGLIYFLFGLSIIAILVCFIFCIYSKSNT